MLRNNVIWVKESIGICNVKSECGFGNLNLNCKFDFSAEDSKVLVIKWILRMKLDCEFLNLFLVKVASSMFEAVASCLKLKFKFDAEILSLKSWLKVEGWG